jgi:hypothetical protein
MIIRMLLVSLLSVTMGDQELPPKDNTPELKPRKFGWFEPYFESEFPDPLTEFKKCRNNDLVTGAEEKPCLCDPDGVLSHDGTYLYYFFQNIAFAYSVPFAWCVHVHSTTFIKIMPDVFCVAEQSQL